MPGLKERSGNDIGRYYKVWWHIVPSLTTIGSFRYLRLKLLRQLTVHSRDFSIPDMYVTQP